VPHCTSALNDNHALAQRSLEPGQRFCPAVTVGDDFRDHGVKFRRDGIAFRHAGVNAYAWSRQNPETFNGTRGRSEAIVRIFRVQPHLNGMTVRRRWLSFQSTAARNMNLKLDQVKPGRAFRHRVLHLQSCVHLHERKGLSFRLVEKFDGASVVISGRLTQAHRRRTQGLILLRREGGRGRLFENLLVAPLNGAVAHARGPGRSVMVGNDLDLNVACALHQLLHEHGRVPEGLKRLGASVLKGFRQLMGGTHAANSVTAASRRGLDHEGIAQAFTLEQGLLQGVHRSVAPGCYCDVRLLGQTLGGNLVTQPAHHISIRPDEHDVQLVAKIGEFGVFGYKAPSDPSCLGARHLQRLLQPSIVNVAALGVLGGWVDQQSGAQGHCLVRLTDEHGVTVGIGKECDRAQRCAVLVIELACRMDETHGGFTAIDDSYALEFAPHKGPEQQMVTPLRTAVTWRLAMVSRLRHRRRWKAPRCGSRGGARTGCLRNLQLPHGSFLGPGRE
jgi:hypothetical protein